MGVSVGRGYAWAWGVFPSPEPTPAISRHKPTANRMALTYDRRIVMLPLHQALKVERCTIGFRRLWYIAHSGMFRYFLR